MRSDRDGTVLGSQLEMRLPILGLDMKESRNDRSSPG